jgi:MFS family permease
MSSEASTHRGLGAAIWSQLFLRIAGSAGVLVIGGYFVELQDKGLPITSVLVGVVTGLVYLTELLLAPSAGALSDKRGRKSFLLAGPLLAAFAVLLAPLGFLASALPPMALVVGLLALSRLIEGLGSAASVPATLGFLSEGTDHDPLRRGRQMSFYELAASGGVAIGAVLGPLLWSALHLFAFVALSIIYLIGAAFVLFGVRDAPSMFRPRSPFDLRRYLELLSDRRLTLFVPAWITVNAILGVWVQAQVVFVLAGSTTVPGQRFVGSLHNSEQELSLILFAYVLWFSICVVAWAFLLGRLPKLPTLLVTLFGSMVASFGLIEMNHGGAFVTFVPVVMAGVFLEAGFVPAALAYLADVSEAFVGERGMLMGLYSLVLGLGYLLGNFLGGVAAQAAYFDGLAYLTMILAAVGIVSLGVLLLAQRVRS